MVTTLEHACELKRKMKAGEPAIGIWMDLIDPCVAEIVGDVGFDWVLIDTEHGPIDIPILQSILMGLKGSSTVPIVRVPWNDQVIIKRTLDVGTLGLVVPLVRTAQDVYDAVSYAKYPPLGVRGCAPRRASQYGRNYQEYLAQANEAISVIVQIEHIEAVRNLDEILAVPGLDGILIGPADLSGSMGLLGRGDAPEVEQVIDETIAKARAAGIAVSLANAGTAQDIAGCIDRGVRMLLVGLDRQFIARMGTQMLTLTKDYLSKVAR